MSKVNLSTIFTLLAVLVAVSVIGALEYSAQNNFKPVAFDPTNRNKIEDTKPDVICIGNSTLGKNIVKENFQEGISEILGKPAKVHFITSGGMHSSWQYLVIKNQIAPTTLQNTPIILFDYEDYFIRPDSKTATAGKSEQILKKNILDDEEVFLRKIGNSSIYFYSGFPYLFSQRFQIKRALTAEAILQFMNITGARELVHSRRFKKNDETSIQWLLQTLFKSENFRSGEADDYARYDREVFTGASPEEFRAKADSSFIPEILKFQPRFKIIFVQSNSNPGMASLKSSLRVYSSRLNEYISSKGGLFIDMNSDPKLQRSGLMHDSRHFRKGEACATNTAQVLAALKERHAVGN